MSDAVPPVTPEDGTSRWRGAALFVAAALVLVPGGAWAGAQLRNLVLSSQSQDDETTKDELRTMLTGKDGVVDLNTILQIEATQAWDVANGPDDAPLEPGPRAAVTLAVEEGKLTAHAVVVTAKDAPDVRAVVLSISKWKTSQRDGVTYSYSDGDETTVDRTGESFEFVGRDGLTYVVQYFDTGKEVGLVTPEEGLEYDATLDTLRVGGEFQMVTDQRLTLKNGAIQVSGTPTLGR